MKKSSLLTLVLAMVFTAAGIAAVPAAEEDKQASPPVEPAPSVEPVEAEDAATPEPKEVELAATPLELDTATTQAGGGTFCEGLCGTVVKIQFTCDFGSTAEACCEKTIENAECPPGTEFHGFCQDQTHEIVCSE